MGYKLVKTDAFQHDLDTVIRYLALSLENKIAAASLLDAVEKCYNDLERMPLMYEACHKAMNDGKEKVLLAFLKPFSYNRGGRTVPPAPPQ